MRLAAVTGAFTVLFASAPVHAAPAPPPTVRKVVSAGKPVAVRKAPALTPVELSRRHARARVRVVSYARAQRGDWYAHGASGPSRWDCSGLTSGAYRTVGIRLPHSSAAQARRGIRVTPRFAKVGDLVAMNGHVGVLVGRWRMVDAPGPGRRVVERAVFRTSTLQFRRLIG
jgi:cell wall-associated NlpC family hydrolase